MIENPPVLPKWLPAEVARITKRSYLSWQKICSPQDKVYLDRLIFDDRMKSVWSGLAAASISDKRLAGFFIAASHSLQMWNWRDRRPDREITKQLKQIIKSAESLQCLMHSMYKFKKEHGSVPLSLIDGGNLTQKFWAGDYIGQDHVSEELLDGPILKLLLNILDMLVFQAQLALDKNINVYPDRKKNNIPRKGRSKTVRRTFFIREVSRMVKTAYGLTLHELIAETAGIIFNELETPDGDLVRKLTADIPLRKIRSVKKR